VLLVAITVTRHANGHYTVQTEHSSRDALIRSFSTQVSAWKYVEQYTVMRTNSHFTLTVVQES